MSDLARRLAQHPRFRDSVCSGMRLLTDRGDGTIRWGRVPEPFATPADGRLWFPDLTDAATAGVLLSMLTAAIPLRTVVVCREQNGTWWVESHIGDTLGEAAAHALLALWGPA
jgi:hypothetical protein